MSYFLASLGKQDQDEEDGEENESEGEEDEGDGEEDAGDGDGEETPNYSTEDHDEHGNGMYYYSNL